MVRMSVAFLARALSTRLKTCKVSLTSKVCELQFLTRQGAGPANRSLHIDGNQAFAFILSIRLSMLLLRLTANMAWKEHCVP